MIPNKPNISSNANISNIPFVPTQPLPGRPYAYPPLRPLKKKQQRSKKSLIYYILISTSGCLFVIALCITGLVAMLIASHTPQRIIPSLSSQDYNVVGKPSVDAAFINKVLQHYKSPASGKGQALYDAGLTYGIDPAYALAFFMQESMFGTRGVATVTHSLGNIRTTAGYRDYQGYRAYKNWEDGFKDWYQLIANVYVNQRGLYTVDQIIPVYAPGTDHNDEATYIRGVKLAVDRWHQGVVEV